MRPIYVFDRFGTMVDTVAWPLSFEHTDELSGDDSIDLEVRGTPLSEGQRLVWLDRHGEWREHVVSDTDDTHSDGQLTQRVHAESPLSDLIVAEYLGEVEPKGVTASQALARALSGTGWTVGTVNVSGTQDFSWYRCSPHDALEEIIEAFDGEYQTHVTIGPTKVTGRSIDLMRSIGSDRGFVYTYGHNLTSVDRSVDRSELYTALYGYGKSLQTEGGGQQRKLDFADINGGKEYVEDTAATARYGVPDGSGGKRPRFGIVEFSDAEVASELLAATRAKLATCNQPAVTYTMDAVRLAEGGVGDPGDVRKGDTIHVRDLDLNIRETARVLKVVYDELHPENDKITFGKRENKLTLKFTETQKATEKAQDSANKAQTSADHAQGSADKAQSGVDDLNERSYDWDETKDIVDTAPGEWLRKVQDRINEEMNSARTYKFTSFEKGDIWANGPLTKDGKPTGNTSAAINLNGLGLRISSKVQNGDFVWTTFGTGEGFTAEVINVGTLRCGDNYLNLDTGEMRIAFNSKVGSGSDTLSGYVNSTANSAASSAESRANSHADTAAANAKNSANSYTDTALRDYVREDAMGDYFTQRRVFEALTNNGALKGLFMDGGRLYINGDYIRTGIIEGTNGNSLWNLNTGYFETVGHITSGGQRHTMYSRLANGTLDLVMDQTSIGSVGTYTSSSNANVHYLGIAAFTGLILAAPGNIGVSYSASGSSISWYSTIREGTLNFVASANVSGKTVTFDKWSASIRHGMLISQTNEPDTSFSTASSKSARLVASVEEASQIMAGVPIHVYEVNTTAQLQEAAESKRIVWQLDDETGELGIPVYTGEGWTEPIPIKNEEPPVVLPLTGYVDERTNLLQQEIEALAKKVGDANLTSDIKAAGRILADGDSDALAQTTREVSK